MFELGKKYCYIRDEKCKIIGEVVYINEKDRKVLFRLLGGHADTVGWSMSPSKSLELKIKNYHRTDRFWYKESFEEWILMNNTNIMEVE